MSIQFEWDPNKAEQHGVSFDEASSVFYDPLAQAKNFGKSLLVIQLMGACYLLPSLSAKKRLFCIISARAQKESDMKKKPISNAKPSEANELPPMHDLDYSKAKPNRFASKLQKSAQVVVLLDAERQLI